MEAKTCSCLSARYHFYQFGKNKDRQNDVFAFIRLISAWLIYFLDVLRYLLIMGRKKARKMMDSDSDLGLEEEMNDEIVHVRPLLSLSE